MLNFEKVILHNFGSYQHTEVNLQNRGFCLVTGQNLFKKDNATSNGSGKSFLWNAICFALVGETISGLHTNLKNINIIDDPTCYVSLCFFDNTDYYKITRHVTPKSDLKIIRNDVDVSGKGIRESEKKLAELLPDLTKNLIASTIIIGQGMPNKFSSFSPSGRKELLEKLTKADFMIEDIKQRVAERLAYLTSTIRVLEDSNLARQSQLAIYKQNLAAKSNELASLQKPNFKEQITKLQEEAGRLDDKIKYTSDLITSLDSTLSELSNEIFNYNTEKNKELDKINQQAAEENKTFLQRQATLVATQSNLRSQIKQYESITDTCPTCGQHLPGTCKPDTTGLYSELQQIEAELLEVNNTVQQLSQKQQKLFIAISSKYGEQLQNLQLRLTNIKAQYTSEQNSLRALEQSKSVLNQRVARLQYEQDTWDERQKNLVFEIEQLNSNCLELDKTIRLCEAELLDKTEHLKVVRKMDTLIKRDFRGFLLSNIITYIDKKAKEYSEIVFGTRDLEIVLDGNDLNISYGGKVFDNLSGGEKQRVDLILQFAIRNMLTAYLNFNANILVLDEITDFLDKKSCGAILKLIETELNTIESVFIISHHATDLELPIDSELVIEKNELGISDIILGV